MAIGIGNSWIRIHSHILGARGRQTAGDYSLLPPGDSLPPSQLPQSVRYVHLVGASMLAGIGFTMSIFISTLAFDDHDLVNASQIAVLLASATASILGSLWFTWFVPKANRRAEDDASNNGDNETSDTDVD